VVGSVEKFSALCYCKIPGAAIAVGGALTLFWGADAENEAGLMSQEGELYLCMKKP
jgi:hypothetical protein